MRCYLAVGFVDTGIDLPDEELPGEVRRLVLLRPTHVNDQRTVEERGSRPRR